MPGRNFTSSNNYRYGFNGQEKVDEISGSGNHNTAEYWEYDTRLGRRWNLDPKPTVGLSDYACFANNPIWFNDVLGDTVIVNLFGKDDDQKFHDVANTALKYPDKQTDDGVFMVFGHSNSGGIQYVDKNGKTQLATTPEEFNIIMSERSPTWDDDIKYGKKIVLNLKTCNSASKEYVTHDGKVIKRENPIADRISGWKGAKNMTVIAPDGYCAYGMSNGKPSILGVRQTNEEHPANTYQGGFITIKNGKRISKQQNAFGGKSRPSIKKINEK
jgi:hypothetical protein